MILQERKDALPSLRSFTFGWSKLAVRRSHGWIRKVSQAHTQVSKQKSPETPCVFSSSFFDSPPKQINQKQLSPPAKLTNKSKAKSKLTTQFSVCLQNKREKPAGCGETVEPRC
jgi:hypothetical protein